jgi:hypothetical protein
MFSFDGTSHLCCLLRHLSRSASLFTFSDAKQLILRHDATKASVPQLLELSRCSRLSPLGGLGGLPSLDDLITLQHGRLSPSVCKGRGSDSRLTRAVDQPNTWEGDPVPCWRKGPPRKPEDLSSGTPSDREHKSGKRVPPGGGRSTDTRWDKGRGLSLAVHSKGNEPGEGERHGGRTAHSGSL